MNHTDPNRRERYCAAIHDAMEPDLSLVDQEPAFQALIDQAAEAAMALADAELAVPSADQSRQFLTTLANLGITSHRLNQIRDAARLHRQQLIGTNELYAVIDADDPVPPPAVSAVVSPPTSRAELWDRIAAALHQDQTPPPTVPWSDEAPMDREFFLRRADAVLAVLPEPTSRAAVLLDAADRMSRKAAKLTNGLDDLAIFVGKARAAEAEILNREADVLRRLAAEAQQQHGTEAQAFDGRCPACGHTVCDGEGPCGARSGDDFCTCPGPPPAEQQPAADEEHVCKPGTGLYWCPTSGQTESDCHGGFDVCCDRPDLHRPIAVQQPAAADGEEA